MLKIDFKLKNETRTCYRFEAGERPDMITLYLKKTQVDSDGIDPKKGVTITIEQKEDI